LALQDANFPLREETRVILATIMEQLARKLKASERFSQKFPRLEIGKRAARRCVESRGDPTLLDLRRAALLRFAAPQRLQSGRQGSCDESCRLVAAV
jgi:hypothetical protein